MKTYSVLVTLNLQINAESAEEAECQAYHVAAQLPYVEIDVDEAEEI